MVSFPGPVITFVLSDVFMIQYPLAFGVPGTRRMLHNFKMPPARAIRHGSQTLCQQQLAGKPQPIASEWAQLMTYV